MIDEACNCGKQTVFPARVRSQVNDVRPQGLVTYWLLSERTDRDKLVDLAVRLGLTMPPEREPATALRSALYAVTSGRRHLVRPLENKGQFAVVEETASGIHLDYAVLYRASVLEDGTLMVEAPQPLADRIREYYRIESAGLPVASVAAWLCGILDKLHAVSLREAGGVYWVPPVSEARWVEIAAGVAAAGQASQPNRVYTLRTHLDSSAIEAVHDALAREIEVESARIQSDIADGELGDRAIATRERQAAALAAKAMEYEQILGRSLTALRQLAETAAVQQAVAALASIAPDTL